MGVALDADDVLGMAAQLEKGAAAFYHKAASLAPDRKERQILLRLSAMENDHEHIFLAMRQRLHARAQESGGGSGGPLQELSLEASALTSWLASNVQNSLHERFENVRGRGGILERAIEFEKDTILFFLHLKNLLADPAEKVRVDELLKEELGHVFTLTGELSAAPPPARSDAVSREEPAPDWNALTHDA